MRAIITCGVHIYPIFSSVYNQERLILQTISVHKQAKFGLKFAVYSQEQVMMARVWYIITLNATLNFGILVEQSYLYFQVSQYEY